MDLGWAGLNETRKGKGCADGMGWDRHYITYSMECVLRVFVVIPMTIYLPLHLCFFFAFFWERDKTDMWGMSG